MKITLGTPVDVVTVPEQKKTISELTIQQMIDNPNRKIVTILTVEIGRIVLWEGADYDAIGQWTDADVISRINTLYP